MPPRGVTSAKRKRQYEHILESEEKAGRGERRAKEIAARTVNKQRRQAGETKTARKRTTRRAAAPRSGARSSGGSRSRGGGRRSRR
jgi:hypothetical protein